MRRYLPLLLVVLLVGIASAQVNTTINPTYTRYDYDFTVTDSAAVGIHVYDLSPNTYIGYGVSQCHGISRQHTQVGPNPTSSNRNPGTTVEDNYSCTNTDGKFWLLKLDGVLSYDPGGGGRGCGGCGVFITVKSGTFSEQ